MGGKIDYDYEINKKLKEINVKYGISISLNAFKARLEKVLNVHPEKILEGYDFSVELEKWRDNTIKTAISLTSDLVLIDELLKPNNDLLVGKMFLNGSDYRKAISEAIKEKWDIKENDNSIEAVIDTFLYYLIYQNNGKYLRQLRGAIVVRQYPYIHLPLNSYYNFTQNNWERYELDASLLDLIKQSAYNYAAVKALKDKGQDYKDQRECLYQLLYIMNDTKREQYLLGDEDIDKKIKKVYSKILKKYGYGDLREEVNQVLGLDGANIKQELKVFLYDKKVLVKYDFSMSLKDWCKKIIDRFINGCPRVKLLLTCDERFIACFIDEISKRLEKSLNYHSKKNRKKSIDENNSFTSKKEVVDSGSLDEGLYGIKTPVSYTQTNVDVLDIASLKDDLSKILKEKKILEAYNYDSDFIYYIVLIADHLIKKEISNTDPPIPRISKRKLKEEECIVSNRDTAKYYEIILKILSLPDSKKYFGIITKKEEAFRIQLKVIEEIHVNLENFTNKEKSEKRQMLITEFNNQGKKGDNYLVDP